MKYSITVKFLAILLAACALVTALVGAFGIALLGTMDLYATADYSQWRERELEERAERMAEAVAQRYATRTFSDCPLWLSEDFMTSMRDWELDNLVGLEPDSYSYTITDSTGLVLDSGGVQSLTGTDYTFSLTSQYPMLTEPSYSMECWYSDGEEYYIRHERTEEYHVTVTVTEESLTSYNSLPVEYIDWLFHIRYGLIGFLVAGLLVSAICAVYLCCVAGKSARNEPLSPGGLNRVPLDLYLAAAVVICAVLLMLALQILEAWVLNESLNIGALALAIILLLIVAIVGIGFCFAAAAQFKMRRFYWWHHSVIGWCLGKLWQGIRIICKAFTRLFRLLPLMWRYLLIGASMGLMLLLALVLSIHEHVPYLLVLAGAVWLIMVCYGAYAYGTLLKGAQRMSQGNLHAKIPTKYLLGAYKKCAEHLNALADVASVAARKQMQSERMKTELITNVSHDIKTPLTSIINYVDLLEKPHTQQEEAQYLEVLGRQSQRLKKLIEDLMEMSKATTGNMSVDITLVDAAEAVKQALGEFDDKLAQAQLIPVFRQPEGIVAMRADGRLTWRVLSNLLSNIVKYALPGTRVYIDVMPLPGQVLISLKNISREPLNVSAEELTERFVRGDVSRNTEGSGLGLNIAKSLMELQNGQLQLLVDGDLFKVTLVFPAG